MKIVLSRDREQNVLSCFDSKEEFKYPQTLDEFNMELDFFQKKKKEIDNSSDNVKGEKDIPSSPKHRGSLQKNMAFPEGDNPASKHWSPGRPEDVPL